MNDRIFISYASQHPVYAQLISTDLKTSGFRTWLDKDDLPHGNTWEAALITAIIEECFALVVIVTREAINSQMVHKEVSTALLRQQVVIPLIFEDGLKIKSSLNKLCPGLGDKHAINFARDGYADAFEKLRRRLAEEADTWGNLQVYIGQLSHFSEIVRQRAVNALANSHDVRVIDSLIAAMVIEPNRHFMIEVYVPALAEFRDERRVVRFLVSLLRARDVITDAFLVDKVFRALGLVGDNVSDDQVNVFASEFLLLLPEDQNEILQNLATSYNEEIRQYAFELSLAFLGQAQDIRQIGAIIALGRMKDKDAIEHLVPLLSTDDSTLREYVFRSLQQLGYDQLPS